MLARRRLALLALLGGVALTLGVGTSAAAAPVDGVEFSIDGSAWSAEPPTALFSDGFVFAPGDSRTVTVRVRNTHGAPIGIAAALTDPRWSHAAAGAAFTVAGSGGSGSGLPATPLASLSPCSPLVPSRVLAAAEVLTVSITVAMRAGTSGTTAQTTNVGFDLALAMTDAAVTAVVADCTSAPFPAPPVVVIPSTPDSAGIAAVPRGELGSTGFGSHLVPSFVVAASAALLGWWLIAVAGKRRTRRAAELDELPEAVGGGRVRED